MTWMLAQETSGGITDILGGASGGWAGAGLLGLVLGWLLLVYLPQKDKQLKELLELHQLRDTQREDANRATFMRVQAEYAVLVTQSRADFKENLANVISHCEREHKVQTDMLIGEFRELKASLDKFTTAKGRNDV